MLRAVVAGVAAPLLTARFARALGEQAERPNHRGSTLTLAEGPAAAVTLVGTFLLGGQLGPAVAAAGGGAVGAWDDFAGSPADAKGLRGHAEALARGQLTTGVVKVVGLGATGVLAAALSRPSHGRASLLRDATLVAGVANLVNLFDLRPGRALKVAGLASLPLGSRPVQGVVLGLLPGDLGERTMLGDTGANALGAALGALAVSRVPGPLRALVLAGVVALTLVSEKVSFSAWIDAHPAARRIDQLGRG